MLRTVGLKGLNENITCPLCGGYFVEATTIMECLHSFCKSCIVKYLDTSFNCPVCQTEIHKTRPLLHVRPDPVLQDLVYKLVPSLYDDYHKGKQEFQKSMESSEETAAPEAAVEQPTGIKVPHVPDPIYVTLEQRQRDKNKNEQIKIFPIRYLRCPSTMPVRILKRFLRMKFFVKESQEVEISRSDEVLFDYLTLKEVARIYGRYGKLAPLDLYFDVIPKNKSKQTGASLFDLGSLELPDVVRLSVPPPPPPPNFEVKENINNPEDRRKEVSPVRKTEKNTSNCSGTDVLLNSMDVDPFDSPNLDETGYIL